MGTNGGFDTTQLTGITKASPTSTPVNTTSNPTTKINSTQVTITEASVPVYPAPGVSQYYAFLSVNSTVQAVSAPGSSTGYTIAPNGPAEVLTFPFNPNSLNFNYRLNKMSFDTYGGRVTQLLSVKIDSLQIQGDAGSRGNLTSFFTALKSLQENQIETQSSILFTIPNNQSDLAKTMFGQNDSGIGTGLSFYVWIRNIDIGWDPTSVTYPYNISFEVEDISYPGYYNSPSNPSGGYGTLVTHIANTALESLFSNSAGSNEVGYGTVSTGSLSLSAYYAGMAPANSLGGDYSYSSAGVSSSIDTTTADGLGSNSIYIQNA